MMRTVGYRKEIDGLRAIAIVSVVLFHAWGQMFPGGYIGVDIFFVISGYLITSIIFEAAERRRFSYKDLWWPLAFQHN
jgi:peptidoglycan/LPS O-acetylase OafA/YrhL